MSLRPNILDSNPMPVQWSWHIEECVRSRADFEKPPRESGVAPGDAIDDTAVRPLKQATIATAVAIAVLTAAVPARAQYLRDATQGFYGGIGVYGGGLCCGPGGAVIGGAGGAAVGGWVYDTQRNFWSQPASPRFVPVYPSRQWGTAGSTPMYLRRRY